MVREEVIIKVHIDLNGAEKFAVWTGRWQPLSWKVYGKTLTENCILVMQEEIMIWAATD